MVVIVLVALGVCFGYAIVGLGQGRPIVGGYKEVAADDPEVQAAAEFAVTEQGRKQNATIKLTSVEHAERQVVAGTNYRLCIKVEINDAGEDVEVVNQDIKVVVYRDLKKAYSLKSWEEADCSESESNNESR